ncbi:MAG: MlaD family protein [Verrucomicrobiota bacterium]|nr:MCE family protein [Chthoniobacterales bacterium]MDQ3626897.1 MlaD family protein [Verrucomicrobiota bacterium]
MNQRSRGLEFKVGLFVFVGLAVLAALVVQFGRVGEGLKTYYGLSVQFPDASGLLKSSDVLMAGAKIGRVAGGPRLAREGQGVVVPLRIYDHVKIPVGSKFSVGSSGLLGDRFVMVTMPPGRPTAFLRPDAQIAGTRETGMDDLTREGGLLVNDLRTAVQNINGTVTRLNEQALSPVNMENLKSSIDRLNQATGNLAQSSGKIDGVIEKAGATMESSKKAADDVQLAIADARKTIQAMTDLMRDAKSGNGMLATLLSNQEVANDLKALISNLRDHGVLFYRDSAAKAEARAAETREQQGGGQRRRNR